MNQKIPRLRMFAGPNGSGKSTFKTIIRVSRDYNSNLMEIKTHHLPAWFKKALGNTFDINSMSK